MASAGKQAAKPYLNHTKYLTHTLKDLILIDIGRSPRRGFPDHAFTFHCTFFAHLLAQQGVRHAPEGEGALVGGI